MVPVMDMPRSSGKSWRMDAQAVIAQLAGAFALPSELSEARPWGNGHINDTYRARWCDDSDERLVLHQRINGSVFRNRAGLMANIDLVCRELERSGVPPHERLQLVPTSAGESVHIDAQGEWWRTYVFVADTVTHEQVTDPAQARAAAQSFGAFLRHLEAVPGSQLVETIPDFHHSPRRVAACLAAVEADSCGRAAECAAEIAFVRERAEFAHCVVDAIAAGSVPVRVTHNDTKINNVLFDASGMRGQCVIDLDTVMPGSLLYDLGDLLRTSTSTAAEDEADTTLIDVDLARVAAVISGYGDSCGSIMTPGERELLAVCGRLITFEIGTRFLTDHLQGDTYFKIHHPGHNLQRARAQFALVAAFEREASAIADICAEAFSA